MIWRHFPFLVLCINKTFSKSFIISPLEFIFDYIVLIYCLLDTACFTYAENNFTRVTSLYDKKLPAPKITAPCDSLSHNQSPKELTIHAIRKAIPKFCSYPGIYHHHHLVLPSAWISLTLSPHRYRQFLNPYRFRDGWSVAV